MQPHTKIAGIAQVTGLGFLALVFIVVISANRASGQNNNAASNRNGNQTAGTSAGTTDNRNGNTNGNTSAGSTRNAADPAKPPCPPADAPAATISDVYREISAKPNDASKSDQVFVNESPKSYEVQLGDVITVVVDHLDTLVGEAKCSNKHIVLFLDDRPIKNAVMNPPTDPAKSVLKFTLKRDADSESVWTYVLGGPTWGTRPTKVSIGLEDKYGIPSDKLLNLTVIPHNWFAFWAVIFTLLLIAFLVLAYKSDLLRDNVQPTGEGERRPYSLARVQAAWWFFLILASYLFIGMITGDFGSTITSTVLGLLGISAGTAVGSAFVDASKATPESAQTQVTAVQSTQAQMAQLDSDIATLKTGIDAAQAVLADQTVPQNDPRRLAATQDLTEKTAQLAAKQSEKTAKLSQLKKMNNQSEHFLLDILSDVNGVSFHRFQMAAWTVVLGIVFVGQVYKVLAMPTFDGSLLALLGISAGTFVGLKIPEPTVPKQQ